MSVPKYDIRQSYEWNYQNAPERISDAEVPDLPGSWSICGIPANSPLGIPAGPLLNSAWIRYYASLGFDVLTYKTVRSRFRASYDPPNLQPVQPAILTGEGSELQPSEKAPYDSWAISFGMPSRDPAEWRADVEKARRSLGKGQVLVVSVVASPEAGWTIEDVARDFADCAVWAAESGAQIVEANLSCPNVCTQEADLYLSPEASGLIAATIRARVPKLPLALKIGLFQNPEQARAVVNAVSPHVNAIATTNSITARVAGMFGGLRRGIGGACITARCLEELRMLAGFGSPLELISVGGVTNANDVRDRLEAGAKNVQLATAAMIDPAAAIRIRKELA